MSSSWRVLRRLMNQARDKSKLDRLIEEVEKKQIAKVEAAGFLERRKRGLVAYRIPTERGMHYMLSVTPEQIIGPIDPVRLLFLLDKSASMGSSFAKMVVPSCKHLYRTLNPSECQIILFGKTVDLIPAHRVRDAGAAFFDSLAVPLEDATNFLGGVEKAVDVMLRDQEEILKRREGAPLFLLVILSDGVDTVNTNAALNEATYERLSRMLQGSNTKCCVRSVNIGKKADTSLAMKAKYHLETVMDGRWNAPLIYARTRAELPKLLAELSSDLLSQFSVNLAVPSTDPFEGLVKNILHPPVHSLNVTAKPASVITALLRGPPPREVLFNDHECSVPLFVYDGRDWLEEDVVMQSELLVLLRRHIEDISVAVLAGKNVQGAIDDIRGIICSVSEAVFNAAEMQKMTPEQRRQTMKRKKQLLQELRELLGRLQETLLMKTATSDAQAQWLTGADKLKFGLRALRYAKRLSLQKLHEELLRLAGAPFQERTTDLVSVTSRLSTIGHLREMAGVGSTTLLEFLYSFGGVGLAARLRRSEACVIDPWRICVDYVSDDAWDTCSALCFMEAAIPLVDSAGEKCYDVVLVGDPRNFEPYRAFSRSTLFQHYLSILFSLNPDLANPRQMTALLAVALVRCVTQLLNPKRQTALAVQNMFRLLYTLRRRMLSTADDEGSYWTALLSKLENTDAAKHLTEAPEDDIGSIAKVLACIVCLPERLEAISRPGHLAELSLALMAEAASRGCRIEVKLSPNQEAHPLLVKALGIAEESCAFPTSVDEPEPKKLEHGDGFDIVIGRKRSGRFFRRELALSNCPPTAVLACLTLSRLLRSNPLFSSLDATLETGDWTPLQEAVCAAMASATMSKFIETFVLPDGGPQLDPPLLQIALYAQGLRHCTSQTRRLGIPSLRDPAKVLHDLARATRAEGKT